MTEPEWTRKICGGLERLGCVVLPLVAGRMQQPGWPDRYVCSTRGDWWLEFKGERTAVRRIQQMRMDVLNKRVPGKAYVVRQPDRIEDPSGALLATFRDAKELIDQLALLTRETARCE